METVNSVSEPHKILAAALLEAKSVSRDTIVKSSDISRSVRERLVKTGFLDEIIKGWYLLITPEGSGTSTAWFSGFWAFIKHYLADRFGEDGYCLSANSSIDYHTGETVISRQLIVITKKASNTNIELPHDVSILLYTDTNGFPGTFKKFNGVNIMPLEFALSKLGPSYFEKKPKNVEIALRMISSVSNITKILLEKNWISAAERIAGAYEYLGEKEKAEQVITGMEVAGCTLHPENPFQEYKSGMKSAHITSPYAGRIRIIWESMREDVIANFPNPPKLHFDGTGNDSSMQIIEYISQEDAYHSLSIEGFQVSESLIQRIGSGDWNPDNNLTDSQHKDALAAKGYLNTFKKVTDSASKVLTGENAGNVFEENLESWYQELYSPLVQAQIIKPADLIGYRNQPVFIKNARHIPPPANALIDSMDTLFQLLIEDEHPAVRAVLGHYIFVYIHPYMDGNGRIGRFLMNLMLISGGYNWTVIRSSERARYMKSLNTIAEKSDIVPFTKFVSDELFYWKNYIEETLFG
ncbi:MAG: Fic family protein [bacterium]|nr:Fic family protein [bacterium]